MLRESDISYFAGLFDGEGCIQCKQYVETKKKHKGPGTRKTKVWRITMEVAMTDGDVINWIKDTFQVGTVKEIDKTRAPTGKPYYKKQYRWRCSHRDAYHICMLIWPHVKTKLHDVEKIINHYNPVDHLEDNIVNLEEYRVSGRKLPPGVY